jgi:hypothetical protein
VSPEGAIDPEEEATSASIDRRWLAVRGLRWLAAALMTSAVMWLATSGAQAEAGPAQKLVDTYSPITMLREQTADPPCNSSEEQFEPTTVDVMLGNPEVKLIDPGGKVATTGPTAADIAGLDERHHLNVPGDPLRPGCTFATDFAALKAAGTAPSITYARIAREEGEFGLVVQYWFFYYFNQFNDLHEGDWEGMQIAFDADTPREALATGPSEIALFQHEGGEKGSWDDPKVQKEGTHPVVYPAAGSHATFYGPAVYVENGRGGSGLGCDNTMEPLRRVEPKPVLIPTDPRVDGPFEWLTYEGHWGQKEKGYNNGPRGPITKLQWAEPFTWMSEVRTRSPELPTGFVLGPQVTTAFCGTVKAASGLVNLDAKSRPAAIAVIAGFILLIVVLFRLTRWRPVELTPLRQERAFGQLVRAARQLYGRHWRPFVLVGLTSVPIIAAIFGLDWLFTGLTGDSQVGVWIRDVATPIGYAVVAAIAIAILRDLERGQPTGYAIGFRDMLQRFRRVVGGQILATLVPLLMAITIIGIPFAIWKYVDWQFVQQEIIFKDKRMRDAFRGSTQLVRGSWWRTVRIAGFLWLISTVTGPVLGFALIFTPLSLTWANAVGSVVYALLVPYVAIGRTLLYWDLSVRKEAAVTEPKRRRWWAPWRRPSPQPG